MYALIVNGSVSKYPYTIGMLRKDNPNVSFPKKPTDELLSEWGVKKVTATTAPSITNTQVVTESDPVLVGDAWTQSWSVRDKTSEELSASRDSQSEVNRIVRDSRLSETDWWASSDLTMTAEQTAYRQALRDITSHANWPFLEEADWPTKPS